MDVRNLGWLLTAVLTGCQGGSTTEPGAGSGSAVGSGSAGSGPGPSAGSGGGEPDADDRDVASADADAAASTERQGSSGGDDGDVADDAELDRLGAVPAWQAVVDRAELLARRGQRAVVIGTVGSRVDPPPVADGSGSATTSAGFGSGAAPAGPTLTWLVDDSEGAGTLAIRVAFRAGAPAEGSRVAVGGAWALDGERRWYWVADGLTTLAPIANTRPTPPDAVPVQPGNRALAAADPPSGARPVSRGRDDGIITFQVLGTPDAEGDGWRIADELGDPVAAFLYLPGERASYGGRDLRADDERWQLRRGGRYWVQIGKVRRRAGVPPLRLNARTPPVRW